VREHAEVRERAAKLRRHHAEFHPDESTSDSPQSTLDWQVFQAAAVHANLADTASAWFSP
jgi:hypothetical protein